MNTSPPRLITIDEAASRFQVPKSWFYERSRKGEIPKDVMLKVGRYLRFNVERLDVWVRANCPARW